MADMFLISMFLATAAAVPGDDWKSNLFSRDVARAVAAAHKLGAARRADVLIDALALGAPPEVAAAMLDALDACKSEHAQATFLRYADHRNPDVRKRALLGLRTWRDPRAR